MKVKRRKKAEKDTAARLHSPGNITESSGEEPEKDANSPARATDSLEKISDASTYEEHDFLGRPE